MKKENMVAFRSSGALRLLLITFKTFTYDCITHYRLSHFQFVEPIMVQLYMLKSFLSLLSAEVTDQFSSLHFLLLAFMFHVKGIYLPER